MNQQRQLSAVEQRNLERQRSIDGFGQFVEAFAPNMMEAAARGVDSAKLRRIVILAVQKNPDLLECSRESWITALTQCAQDGLMPDGREAAFVKFKGEVVYMPMVYGLRKKILQSGEISNIFTAVVYEEEHKAGLFEVELGSNPRIMHKPLLGDSDRGRLVACYSIATFKDGTTSFEIMTAADVAKVRAVSRAKDAKDGPWINWEGEMFRKTVLRRHSKSLPMNSDIRDVEVESMFGNNFDRVIAPSADDRGLAGGPARSSQIAHDTTRGQLDDLEDRVFGNQVEVEGKQDEGELVDDRGEARHRGNRAEEKPKQQQRERPKPEPDREPEQQEDDSGDDEQQQGDEDPRAAAADKIIEQMNAATTLIDLRKVKNDRQEEIDAFDDENAGRINRAFRALEDKMTSKK